MNPKVIKQVHAEFTPARYNGVNTAGWHPIGDYVLVKPDTVANKTSGGVELPEDLIERMELASMTGVIVAHTRTVTENEVGESNTAAVCYVGTKRDIRDAGQ